MPDLRVLSLDVSDHVATLTLDRPDALNAMGPAFFEELPAAMTAIEEAKDVRVVLLQAAGRAFCAGLDLKQMGPEILQGEPDASPVQQRAALRDTIRSMQAAITSVAECRVPVIAAIQGPCIGGAIDLISACDIRLATTDATFSVRETRMAMVADLGTLQRLPQILPDGYVAELVYTGKDVSGQRAAEMGLVNRVVDTPEALQEAAREMAQQIAANSPLAVEGAKHVLRKSRTQSVEEGLSYVATWNAAFLQSQDLVEAFEAFTSKREPTFTGS